jgi:hypothetical protein
VFAAVLLFFSGIEPTFFVSVHPLPLVHGFGGPVYYVATPQVHCRIDESFELNVGSIAEDGPVQEHRCPGEETEHQQEEWAGRGGTNLVTTPLRESTSPKSGPGGGGR